MSRPFPGERRTRWEVIALVVTLLTVGMAIGLVAYRDEPTKFVAQKDAVGAVANTKTPGSTTTTAPPPVTPTTAAPPVTPTTTAPAPTTTTTTQAPVDKKGRTAQALSLIHI